MFISVCSFLLSSVFHFHPCVLPEEPFHRKRWGNIIFWGIGWTRRLPFLCGGKDSNVFPHISTLKIFRNFAQFQFLKISLLLHIYLHCGYSGAFLRKGKRKIERPFCWFWFVVARSSDRLPGQGSKKLPNDPERKIEARRKRKSLQG